MKKSSLFLTVSVVFVVCASLACGEISQQGASELCMEYSLSGESVQVSGPVACEGDFWVCGFTYYGNDQNFALFVSSGGNTLNGNDEKFDDLLRLKYAIDSENNYALSNQISTGEIASKLSSANTTITNYVLVFSALKEDGIIDNYEYLTLSKAQKNASDMLSLAMKDSLLARNASDSFWGKPDCVGLLDFLGIEKEAVVSLKNFSSAWKTLILEYNRIAEEKPEAYLSMASTQVSEQIGQYTGAIAKAITEFEGSSKDYSEKAIANLPSREEKVLAKVAIDSAWETVSGSSSSEAVTKYNAAANAFNAGNYASAKSLALESINIAANTPAQSENTPTVITEKSTDYTVYFIAVGILLGAIVVAVLISRKSGEKKEPKEEKPDLKKNGDWAWTKKDADSIGKAIPSHFE